MRISFEQKRQTLHKYGIDDLLEIMRMLRAPDGCPWDREQTHPSIRKNFIEEAYEVAEAIDLGDMQLLREELGDVLLQVVFHAQMANEADRFDFTDVCDGICRKLILRHPHIFSDVKADTSGQVLENWDAIKRREKHQATHTQTLESVPVSLPALMRSEKIQHRAAKAGFGYPDTDGAMHDLLSEVQELRAAINSGDGDNIDEELGDLLFATVNVARHVGVDAEHSLLRSCKKFLSRFSTAENLALARGQKLECMNPKELDILWVEVKNKE